MGVWKKSLSEIVTGIDESKTENRIYIYPNPCNDILHFSASGIKNYQNTYISVYDVLGNLVIKNKIMNSQSELNISELSKGVYFIKIENTDNNITTKFIKE